MVTPHAAACLARMRVLRDEWAATDSRKRHPCARSAEWSGLSLETRMAVLLLAGIDGDLTDLAGRAWPEFTPPERDAILLQFRGLWRELTASFMLRRR